MNYKHLIMMLAALTVVSGAFAQVQRKEMKNATQMGKTLQQKQGTKEMKEIKMRQPVYKQALDSKSSEEEKDKARRKAINDYLLKEMFKMENPANLVRDVKGQKLPQFVIENGDLYELKEIPHNVDTKDVDIFTEDNNRIYPGVLLVADKGLANGNPKTVAGMGYGRVDISLDIDTGGKEFSKKNVENSYAEVMKAVRELVRQIYESKYSQPARMKSITGDYSSTEEIAIKAGCDVNFAAKFSASVSTDEKHVTITHLDDLSQIYYNVVVTPAGGDYSNLFGPDVTVDKIKEMVAQYKAPFVFVNQMSFGRRLYKFSEYKASDFKMDASASASYSGASFTSSSNIMKNQKASSTSVYMKGGDPSLGSGLIQDEATVRKVLSTYDNNGSNKALTLNQYNQGLPMSFTTTYLGSQDVCQRGTTGKYYTAEYKKCINRLTLKVRSKLDNKGLVNSRIKPKFYYRTMLVDENSGKILKRNIEHDPIEKEMTCDDTWQYTLELKKGEYLDGNISCSVRTRYSGNWKQSMSDNYIDPIQYDGKVGTLVFAGTVHGNVYVSIDSDVEFIGIKKGKY